MIGNPKFEAGDKVNFTFEGFEKTGIIEIVDEYGTWDYPDDVSYDIFIDDENMLYKHIPEIHVQLYEG